MYNFKLSRQAGKDLERVYRADQKLCQRFLNVFETISEDPDQGKPLRGELRGMLSYRMGSYRIIYEVHRGKLIVVVIDLGHRGAIYRQ